MRVGVLAQVAHDLVGRQPAGQGAHSALPGEHAHKKVGQDALAAREQPQDGPSAAGRPCRRTPVTTSLTLGTCDAWPCNRLQTVSVVCVLS